MKIVSVLSPRRNQGMQTKSKFPSTTSLKLYRQKTWVTLCKVDLFAFEDNDLARHRAVGEVAIFEPMVYLRCEDLSDGDAQEIQQTLASGGIPWISLAGNRTLIEDGLSLKMMRIHEVYRCAAFLDEDVVESVPKRFSFRWMITAFRCDEFPELLSDFGP